MPRREIIITGQRARRGNRFSGLPENEGISLARTGRQIFPDGFLPASLPGLRIWLEARTIGLPDGTDISSSISPNRWLDISGNGRHQFATAGTQPYRTAGLNGQPAVELNVAGERLGFLPSAATIPMSGLTEFFVFRASAGFGANPHLAHTLILPPLFGEYASAISLGNAVYTIHYQRVEAGIFSRKVRTAGASFAKDDVGRVFRHECDGTHAGHKLFIDGAEEAMTDVTVNDPGAAAFTAGSLALGGSNTAADNGFGINCHVAAYLLYTGMLSNANARLIELYLGALYGIAIP